MRRLLYVVILVAVFFAPVDRLDVADLEPVQVVAVYRKEGQIALKTDTDDEGKGKNAEYALEDMKQKTPTIIYLDTAEYLLVEPGVETEVELLKEYLSNSVKVAPYNGGALSAEALYADLHNQLPRITQWLKENQKTA